MTMNVVKLSDFRQAKTNDRRTSERVKYPYPERPILEIKTLGCKVINISENGMKFMTHASLRIEEGAVVAGNISFKQAGDVFVIGKAVRVVGDLVSIHLFTDLPESVLYQEKLRLAAMKEEATS